MGYKVSDKSLKPLRQDGDEGKTPPKKAMVPKKNMVGDNADGKEPYHAEVHADSLFNMKDGEYSKAALNQRIQGYRDAIESVIESHSEPDTSSGPTTSQAYPTKMDLSKYGFSRKGSN